MKSLILFLAVFVAAISAEQTSYRGYKAYLVTPASIAEWEVLKELEGAEGIDYWDGIKRTGGSRVMVSPAKQAEYEHLMVSNNITYELIVPDVEE
jgi:hypothetical protein